MKNSKEDARRWLRQAENDLAVARLILREGFFAQACFMSHQVAEKALKALAYNRGDRFVTGHSLIDLLSTLVTTYKQLAEHTKLAKALDRYYVPTRYPDALPGSVPFEVYDDEDEAREAVEGAAAVVETARSVVAD